ncbi:hypothetical protein KUTeg_016064 [Tegillarca granosa]|uniref:Malate dehydrogenase n=1 Tax=Tegillarca granosa TaxID=220873 RepID=A0ABQ9EKX6_TEGGR|nr:hypothetical protein KUTeg_016064 [Tegillarca granosa]
MASVVCNRCWSLSNLLRNNITPVNFRRIQTDSSEAWDVISLNEVQRFIKNCMTSVGTSSKHAESLADNLVAADYRGHYSHGLNRLDMYVHDVKTNITAINKEPITVKETSATALVDGNNVLGPVVGNYSIDLAIQKARTAGIGFVVAKGSNHFGIAGWYALRACQQGLLPILGTNPLSLAAPSNTDSFVLDMATSTVALGKMSNDPKPVLDGGGLMPVGGSELTGGYKGYGLAMLVEIFCGILSGSAYGPNIRRWKDTDREANLIELADKLKVPPMSVVKK